MNMQTQDNKKWFVTYALLVAFILLSLLIILFILFGNDGLKRLDTGETKTSVTEDNTTTLEMESTDNIKQNDGNKEDYATIEGKFSVNFGIEDESLLLNTLSSEFIKVCAEDISNKANKYCTDNYLEFETLIGKDVKYQIKIPSGNYSVYAILPNNKVSYYNEFKACTIDYSREQKEKCNQLIENETSLIQECFDGFPDISEVCMGDEDAKSILSLKAGEAVGSIHLDNDAEN